MVGVDAAFSMEPAELKQLVNETNRAWQAKGQVWYGVSYNEQGSLKFRRSIYIKGDVQEGGILTKNNMQVVRPGFGLAPKYFNILLGKRVNRSLSKGGRL